MISIKSKFNIRHIIQEVLAEAIDDEKIAMAKEQISTIDAQRGIEAGSFDNQHVAAALRNLADEYDAAEPGEHWWGTYEAPEEEDYTGYTKLHAPTRQSHERMKRGARTGKWD